MSRRSQAPKRTVLPDPKFGSELLAKFMNMIMNDGKKSVAERIIYGAIDRIAETIDKFEEDVLGAVDAGARAARHAGMVFGEPIEAGAAAAGAGRRHGVTTPG